MAVLMRSVSWQWCIATFRMQKTCSANGDATDKSLASADRDISSLTSVAESVRKGESTKKSAESLRSVSEGETERTCGLKLGRDFVGTFELDSNGDKRPKDAHDLGGVIGESRVVNGVSRADEVMRKYSDNGMKAGQISTWSEDRRTFKYQGAFRQSSQEGRSQERLGRQQENGQATTHPDAAIQFDVSIWQEGNDQAATHQDSAVNSGMSTQVILDQEAFRGIPYHPHDAQPVLRCADVPLDHKNTHPGSAVLPRSPRNVSGHTSLEDWHPRSGSIATRMSQSVGRLTPRQAWTQSHSDGAGQHQDSRQSTWADRARHDAFMYRSSSSSSHLSAVSAVPRSEGLMNRRLLLQFFAWWRMLVITHEMQPS